MEKEIKEKVCDLRVTYKGYDYDLDEKITKFFKGLGFHFWASGRNLEDGYRDICFEPEWRLKKRHEEIQEQETKNDCTSDFIIQIHGPLIYVIEK